MGGKGDVGAGRPGDGRVGGADGRRRRPDGPADDQKGLVVPAVDPGRHGRADICGALLLATPGHLGSGGLVARRR